MDAATPPVPDDPARSLGLLLADARERLRDAPQEGLAELQTGRRTLGIPRAPRVVPRGHAWHLGVLLLSVDALRATGDIIRARAEVRRGFPAESQRRRAEIAAAVRRGGYAEGETVHLGWHDIDLSAVARGEASAPLDVRDGVVVVRWSPSGGLMPLERYLDERVELLVHPLRGAT